MPQAVPLIIGAAAASAVPATFTLFGLSAVGTAMLVGAAASTAASMLLMPRPQQPASLSAGLTLPGGGRTQQVRQPTPSHEVVVGRIKKSGPIMFMYSGPDNIGRADGFFYMVHALAAHHVKAIGDVYINTDLATDAKYSGLTRFAKYLGTTTQIADPDFVADTAGEWTVDHRLRGRAVLYSRLFGSATAFPGGLPNLSAIVWGADEITDPRTGIAGWTNNAILIIYWWMTWGEGYDSGDFDEAALIAAANVCDERVRIAAATTTFQPVAATGSPTIFTGECTLAARARSLDVGDGVRVSTSGTLPGGLVADTTYYVIPSDGGTIKFASSVANAFAGTAVNITTAGTGTQTLTYWDEARYKLNGSFTLDQEKRDIRDQLLTACAGLAVEIGGIWILQAGAAVLPTVTLDEDDLRDAMVTAPKRSMRDRFNGVRAVFVNPDNGWQPSDAPKLLNATTAPYVAEDNGVELFQDVRLPFTTSARAAQRLMKIHLERNRRQRAVKFPAKLTAMRLRPLDGCYIDNQRYGWIAEQHQVMGWMLAEDGGIDLQLQEDSAAVYDWSSAEEVTVSVPQDSVLPDPSSIDAPASVTVTTPVTPTYTSLSAAWAAVSSIWLDGYDVEYRNSGGSDWTGYGRVGAASSLAVSVERSTPQDFQVRSVTMNGSTSGFTQNLAPAVPTAPAAVGGANKIDLSWVNGAGSATVQIFRNTVNTFSSAALLTTVAGTTYSNTGLGVAETYYYWFRSVNSGGNISTNTASVNATTNP